VCRLMIAGLFVAFLSKEAAAQVPTDPIPGSHPVEEYGYGTQPCSAFLNAEQNEKEAWIRYAQPRQPSEFLDFNYNGFVSYLLGGISLATAYRGTYYPTEIDTVVDLALNYCTMRPDQQFEAAVFDVVVNHSIGPVPLK
jgi:hypothetical protein